MHWSTQFVFIFRLTLFFPFTLELFRKHQKTINIYSLGFFPPSLAFSLSCFYVSLRMLSYTFTNIFKCFFYTIALTVSREFDSFFFRLSIRGQGCFPIAMCRIKECLVFALIITVELSVGYAKINVLWWRNFSKFIIWKYFFHIVSWFIAIKSAFENLSEWALLLIWG